MAACFVTVPGMLLHRWITRVNLNTRILLASARSRQLGEPITCPDSFNYWIAAFQHGKDLIWPPTRRCL